MSNSVRLEGRLSKGPEERVLPSGDTVWVFRVVVPRDEGSRRKGDRNGVDWVDCAVWAGRLRRTVATWSVGDEVAVEGALRRRFFRAGGRPVSRVEVEATAGRVIRRGGPS